MFSPFGLGFGQRRVGAFVALLCLLAPMSIASTATGETFEAGADNVKVPSYPNLTAPVFKVLEYGRNLKIIAAIGMSAFGGKADADFARRDV